jgi:hypothetical protein
MLVYVLHFQAKAGQLQQAANIEKLLQGVAKKADNLTLLAAYLTPTQQDRWHRDDPYFYSAHGEVVPHCLMVDDLVSQLADAVGEKVEEHLQ